MVRMRKKKMKDQCRKPDVDPVGFLRGEKGMEKNRGEG